MVGNERYGRAGKHTAARVDGYSIAASRVHTNLNLEL